MKKKIKVDELRPKYDLKKLFTGAVRSKYASQYRASKNSAPKVDRGAFSVTSSFDDSDPKQYWLSRTPEERLRQMEILRRINYGNLATQRLQRVLKVTQREKS